VNLFKYMVPFAYLCSGSEHNTLWYKVGLALYVYIPLIYHNQQYSEVCTTEIQRQELPLLCKTKAFRLV